MLSRSWVLAVHASILIKAMLDLIVLGFYEQLCEGELQLQPSAGNSFCLAEIRPSDVGMDYTPLEYWRAQAKDTTR